MTHTTSAEVVLAESPDGETTLTGYRVAELADDLGTVERSYLQPFALLAYYDVDGEQRTLELDLERLDTIAALLAEARPALAAAEAAAALRAGDDQ
ncbi:hypothetical protein ABFU82_22440 [Nocardioides sp. WV_118_6]